MKKIKSLLIVTCLLAFVLASCGGDSSKKLVNNWAVTDIETGTELSDSMKTSLLSGSEMTFTKDGEYTAVGGIGADQGTYTVDKDGKTLSTTSAAGKSNEVYSIETLTDDKLVLGNKGNKITCTVKK